MAAWLGDECDEGWGRFENALDCSKASGYGVDMYVIAVRAVSERVARCAGSEMLATDVSMAMWPVGSS